MNKYQTIIAKLLPVILLLISTTAGAFDTDLFTASSSSTAPNVLIVIDNTSNWSRNDEKFPDGNGGTITQGQAEVNAIKSVIQSLTGYINVGMLEFVTGGPATDNGGYIRFAISPMGSSQTNGATNQTTFSNTLTTIYGNISGPTEKFNSGTAYGNLMYDAYNYYAGLKPFTSSGDVVSSLADSNGYVTNYSLFKSPLSANSVCANNYIIFIGNPPASGPYSDTSANTSALSSAGGDTTQLQLQNYTKTTQSLSDNLGYSSSCFSSAPTGTPTDYTSLCPSASTTYNSCTYSSTDTTATLPTCSTGTQRYSVIANTPISSSVTNNTYATNSGKTSSCYTSSTQWTSSDTGTTPTCPSTTTSTTNGVTTTTSYSCSYSIGSQATTSSCSTLTSTSLTTSCYNSNGNGSWTSSSSDYGTLTCPSGYTCTYSGASGGSTSSCTGSKSKWTITQTATPGSTVHQYNLTQTVSQTITTSSGSTQSTIGNTFACYSSQPSGTVSSTDLPATGCPSGSTCSYGSATTAASCPTGETRYQVLGNYTAYVDTPAGTYTTDTNPFNADEWAKFMYQKGISVSGASTSAKVTTYTIDVYGVKPDAVQSSLLSNMAKYGGGRYLTATNATAIKTALQNIFSEIQAVNTTFASAALPISATNRTQNDNQVFIGMFRPDQHSLPRWYGNLKQYKFGIVNGSTTLVDANSSAAVSSTSGFIDNCAQSYWTTDSGNYWANVNSGSVTPRIFFTTATTTGLAWTTQGDDTNLAQGQCSTNSSGSTYSDLPDGPIVEKGGVAEVLRKSSSRTIKTINSMTGTTLVDFNSTNVTNLSSNSTINANIVNFIRGQDVTGEIGGSASSSNRASIHGDVIHSKPLAIDFGGTYGVNVYYGANDGTYRSVNTSTGVENWAFVAPESFATLQRLLDNTPVVQTPYPTPSGSTAASGSPKDFFFDGSTGVYQNSDSSKVWIYPSMRRGGNMIYAFDESIGTTKPKVLWKAGCNSSGCTDSQLSNIGQTWSTPNVAFLTGYSTTTPVVIIGGGYDTCEDADGNPSASGFCSSPKGSAVYVLDGSTGVVVKAFTTDRSVAADVTLVDVNLDGKVDLAYVADTGGNIYRINFSDPSNNFAALSSSNWTIKKVAYTSGSGRKFLFAPAVLPYKNQVYIAIGSGDREHPTALSYPYTTPITNRFYVYLDDPSAASTTAAVNMDSGSFYNYTTSSTDTCSSPGVIPGSTKTGWFIDLTENGTGEQVVTSALINSGLIAFSTNRPIANEVCSTDLGEARGYLINLLNGSGAITASGKASCGGYRSSIFVGGGLPPSPVSGVVVIDGKAEQVVIGVAQHDGSTSTSISPQKITPPIKSTRSRLYWRSPTDTH